jgi:hypothetical protein
MRKARKSDSRKPKTPRKRLPPAVLPLIINDDQVLSLKQWCSLNNFGVRTGTRILSGPGGPIVTELSAGRVGITYGNNRAWQKSRARA